MLFLLTFHLRDVGSVFWCLAFTMAFEMRWLAVFVAFVMRDRPWNDVFHLPSLSNLDPTFADVADPTMKLKQTGAL